jgi:Vitamin K-dependent gamma-carboxylase
VNALVRRVDGWMFGAAPPERLAALRILCGLFAVVYLAVRHQAFLVLADASPSRFEPVGVLAVLDGPLPDGVLVALIVGTLIAGIAFTAGAWFRVSGPAFAVLLLVLTTYRSSWGRLLYFENLMVLHVVIVGLACSADAWSLDVRRRRYQRSTGDSASYGWPVRLAAAVTVLTYVLAGVAKLRIGGIDWMVGDTLRNHVAFSAARLDVLGATPSPLARPAVGQSWVFPPLAVATVLVEVGAPVALLGGRVRTVWVVAAWSMHVGIAALMFVVFPYPLALVAFAPLFALERLPTYGGSSSRRRPG